MRTSYAAEDTLARVLHRTHARPVRAYVRRLLAEADAEVDAEAEADDILADTLLRAVRAPGGLSADAARARLFQDARGLVVQRLRARDPGRREGAPEPVPELPDRFGDAELDRALLGWQVAEALGSLSETHRTLLVELVLAGRSVSRLATLLRLTEDAVRHRTYFALQAFRLALDERGVTPR